MNVVIGGDRVIDALLFGAPLASNQSFIKSEINRFASSAVGEFGTQLASRMRNLYESFHNSAAMNMMQAALNQTRALVMPDTIYRFNRIEDFQIAQPQMQRLIMANPVIRKLYQEQRCDGYSDSYVDPYPGLLGPNDPIWQSVENGHVVEDASGEISWTNYSKAYDETHGELHLNQAQQHAIFPTWRALEKIVEKGEYDPTSVWNTKL